MSVSNSDFPDRLHAIAARRILLFSSLMFRRFAFFCAFVLAGCQRVPKEDQVAALETVQKNVRALESENLEAMMATIHPESPVFAATRKSVEALVKEFDLRFELSGLEVSAGKKGELRVKFEQVTERKKDGVAEPRTRMIGTHVLRKDGGVWKMFDTEVVSAIVIDPLPDDPEPAAESAAKNP